MVFLRQGIFRGQAPAHLKFPPPPMASISCWATTSLRLVFRVAFGFPWSLPFRPGGLCQGLSFSSIIKVVGAVCKPRGAGRGAKGRRSAPPAFLCLPRRASVLSAVLPERLHGAVRGGRKGRGVRHKVDQRIAFVIQLLRPGPIRVRWCPKICPAPWPPAQFWQWPPARPAARVGQMPHGGRKIRRPYKNAVHSLHRGDLGNIGHPSGLSMATITMMSRSAPA